jgi:hypothetical protein
MLKTLVVFAALLATSVLVFPTVSLAAQLV